MRRSHDKDTLNNYGKQIFIIFNIKVLTASWKSQLNCFKYSLNTWPFYVFKVFTVLGLPTLTDIICASICGFYWLQWKTALTPSYLTVSMRNIGVRCVISHHLASLISRFNPVRVILLMLLLSSFLPFAYCTLLKFYALNWGEYLRRKKEPWR